MVGPRNQGQQQLPLLKKNEQAQNNDTIVASDDYYGFFLISGWLHIKWFALVKHVFLFFYLLRMMQSDLVQAELDCFFPMEDSKSNYLNKDGKLENGKYYYRDRCLKNICVWVHNIVGLVPRFLIRDFSNLCLVFLFLGFFSCFAVLLGLYNRERRKNGCNGFHRFLLTVAVIASMTFEMFVAFFWYYAIIMSIHWRVQPHKGIPTLVVVRSLFFAAVLSILMFIEIVLHVISLYYISVAPSEQSFLLSMYNPTSPTGSVLECIKHPGLSRQHVSQPKMSAPQAPNYEDSFLTRTNDSGNVSRDSGFGRHSPYARNAAGGSYSPNGYPPNGAVFHNGSPNFCNSQGGEMEFSGRKMVSVNYGDMNTTRTSNYEHIREEGVMMTARPQQSTRVSGPLQPHSDDSDITYEVV